MSVTMFATFTGAVGAEFASLSRRSMLQTSKIDIRFVNLQPCNQTIWSADGWHTEIVDYTVGDKFDWGNLLNHCYSYVDSEYMGWMHPDICILQKDWDSYILDALQRYDIVGVVTHGYSVSKDIPDLDFPGGIFSLARSSVMCDILPDFSAFREKDGSLSRYQPTAEECDMLGVYKGYVMKTEGMWRFPWSIARNRMLSFPRQQNQLDYQAMGSDRLWRGQIKSYIKEYQMNGKLLLSHFGRMLKRQNQTQSDSVVQNWMTVVTKELDK